MKSFLIYITVIVLSTVKAQWHTGHQGVWPTHPTLTASQQQWNNPATYWNNPHQPWGANAIQPNMWQPKTTTTVPVPTTEPPDSPPAKVVVVHAPQSSNQWQPPGWVPPANPYQNPWAQQSGLQFPMWGQAQPGQQPKPGWKPMQQQRQWMNRRPQQALQSQWPQTNQQHKPTWGAQKRPVWNQRNPSQQQPWEQKPQSQISPHPTWAPGHQQSQQLPQSLPRSHGQRQWESHGHQPQKPNYHQQMAYPTHSPNQRQNTDHQQGHQRQNQPQPRHGQHHTQQYHQPERKPATIRPPHSVHQPEPPHAHETHPAGHYHAEHPPHSIKYVTHIETHTRVTTTIQPEVPMKDYYVQTQLGPPETATSDPSVRVQKYLTDALHHPPNWPVQHYEHPSPSSSANKTAYYQTNQAQPSDSRVLQHIPNVQSSNPSPVRSHDAYQPQTQSAYHSNPPKHYKPEHGATYHHNVAKPTHDPLPSERHHAVHGPPPHEVGQQHSQVAPPHETGRHPHDTGHTPQHDVRHPPYEIGPAQQDLHTPGQHSAHPSPEPPQYHLPPSQGQPPQHVPPHPQGHPPQHLPPQPQGHPPQHLPPQPQGHPPQRSPPQPQGHPPQYMPPPPDGHPSQQMPPPPDGHPPQHMPPPPEVHPPQHMPLPSPGSPLHHAVPPAGHQPPHLPPPAGHQPPHLPPPAGHPPPHLPPPTPGAPLHHALPPPGHPHHHMPPPTITAPLHHAVPPPGHPPHYLTPPSPGTPLQHAVAPILRHETPPSQLLSHGTNIYSEPTIAAPVLEYGVTHPDGSITEEVYNMVATRVQRLISFSTGILRRIVAYILFDRNRRTFAIRSKRSRDVCYAGLLDQDLIDSFLNVINETKNVEFPHIEGNSKVFFFKEEEQILYSDVLREAGTFVAGSCGKDSFMFRISRVRNPETKIGTKIIPGSACPFGPPLRHNFYTVSKCSNGTCPFSYTCNSYYDVCCPDMPTTTNCFSFSIGQLCVTFMPGRRVVVD